MATSPFEVTTAEWYQLQAVQEISYPFSTPLTGCGFAASELLPRPSRP